jgi:hypothetical protein
MGLGFRVAVSRLSNPPESDLASVRDHPKSAHRGNLAGENFAWAKWLFDGVDEGDGAVVEDNGGFPNTYVIRARRCPAAVDQGVPGDEWLFVEIWDEG